MRRLVVVSIIGTDKATGGYGVAKLAHEHATLTGPTFAEWLASALP